MGTLQAPSWYVFKAGEYPDDALVLDCGSDGTVLYFVRGENPDLGAMVSELTADLASWRSDPQGAWIVADWGERMRPNKYRYWTL